MRDEKGAHFYGVPESCFAGHASSVLEGQRNDSVCVGCTVQHSVEIAAGVEKR